MSLVFENGAHRCFSMVSYIAQNPRVRLKTGYLFQAAFVENGTVTWPGNIDIDPETLYEYSMPLTPEKNETLLE